MDIIRQIAEWAHGFLDKTMFVVDVENKPGSNKISVYIDGDNGVTIESCRMLSRYLSEMLDGLDYGDKAYYLEVSSPGVDKPLQFPRQYRKHIGREMLIRLTSATELTGKLMEVNEQGIVLHLKDKKKLYKEAKEKAIAFEEIAESTVLISFKQ
ncbi:MAG: ribosome maturation factor RimP [Bacteroidia bacterium]|jgi:ribosome maturation factor RimP